MFRPNLLALHRRTLVAAAAGALITVGLTAPGAQAEAKASISLTFQPTVTVGDTAVAQIKVKNGGDTTFGLTAVRVLLACNKLGPAATTCNEDEEREVFGVRSAQAVGGACGSTTFRATRTSKSRLLIEPLSNLGGPALAVPLKKGESCAIDLTLAVRLVPAADADGAAGVQTKAAVLAVIQNLGASTELPALAPDDNATVTVDPPKEPVKEVPPIKDEPIETPPAPKAPTAPKTPTCQGMKATMVGTGGGDNLRGTAGRDVIVGGGGNDIIKGGAGKDVICGGGGNDVLKGGTGSDDLRGGGGNDRLAGGRGSDRHVGGVGTDKANGGPGTDSFSGVEQRKN